MSNVHLRQGVPYCLISIMARCPLLSNVHYNKVSTTTHVTRDMRHPHSCDELSTAPVLFLAQYRKSFPSVSASFPSPYCDNSADDSNTSSPRSLRHATGGDRQPCYQFRKSNSMKLALKEDVEGDRLQQFIDVVPALIRCRRLMMLCYVYFSDNFRLQFSGSSHDLRSDSVFIS